MISDPYIVLGIERDASKEEIKKAYRKKAKEYHPDLHPNDPTAAEKMNKINEAYDMLNNPEKYQKQQHNSYSERNTYQRSTYGNTENEQRYSGYGDFWGFDFEDLFGFGQRQQEIQKPKAEPTDNEEIRSIIDFINIGKYDYANQLLNQMVSANRNARWHYLSALANQGMGNRIRALEEIQKAMQMEPGNSLYTQVYNSMRQSGNAYRSSSQEYQQYADGMQKFCRGFCTMQFFCTFCRCY